MVRIQRTQVHADGSTSTTIEEQPLGEAWDEQHMTAAERAAQEAMRQQSEAMFKEMRSQMVGAAKEIAKTAAKNAAKNAARSAAESIKGLFGFRPKR